ncbi:MAG: sucrase ferredoxin, partial [Kineosporiaceae bacterium]
GRSAPTDSRLDRYASGRLADAAERADVRVLLVRRPGRHAQPPDDSPRAWAVVDTRPGREQLRWGRWRHEHELLEVDLASASAAEPPAAAAGAQRLALVCTQGRHDLCCAVRGRPVALAVAADAPGCDVWECSHVGGDRFAANLLLLPAGEMLGGLDPETAVTALRRFGAGRLDLPHSRGRVGRPPLEQAALHYVAVATGEDRLGTFRVVGAAGEEPRWTVDVVGAGLRHRVTLEAHWSSPARLTCSAPRPGRARRLDLVAIDALDPAGTRRS